MQNFNSCLFYCSLKVCISFHVPFYPSLFILSCLLALNNILHSPFSFCLDSIFASVVLYLALISPSSESNVLLNSFIYIIFTVWVFCFLSITRGIFTHTFIVLCLILTKTVSCSSLCITFRLLKVMLNIFFFFFFLPALT